MVRWLKSKTCDGYLAVISGEMVTVCKTGDEWVVMSRYGEHEFFTTARSAKKWAENFYGDRRAF